MSLCVALTDVSIPASTRNIWKDGCRFIRRNNCISSMANNCDRIRSKRCTSCKGSLKSHRLLITRRILGTIRKRDSFVKLPTRIVRSVLERAKDDSTHRWRINRINSCKSVADEYLFLYIYAYTCIFKKKKKKE